MDINELLQDPRKLAEEIDELAGTSGHNAEGNTHFAADMAAVLVASDAAFEAEAIRYFHRLQARLRDVIQRQVDEAAEAEADRLREEGEEARAWTRDMSRAWRDAA